MSAAATAYVIKYSPYKGVGYALHLMVADVVNDANDNRFWMSPTELARKARTTRVSASNWLWQEAVRDGLLEVVVDNRAVRSPGTGYAPASEFRFLEPAVAVAYEPQWKTKQGPPPAPPEEATRVNSDDAARVKTDDAVVEPRQPTVRGRVNSDDAAIREPAGQSVEPRKDSLRVTQTPLTKPSQLNNRASGIADNADTPPESPPLADDAREGSELAAIAPATTTGPSEEAILLATLIRDRFQAHNDRAHLGGQVRMTGASINDADLLLRRGPLPTDDNDRVFTPEPIPYERAERLVKYVFDNAERDNGGFTWADQIRSGGSLRRHWYKAASWANGHREAAKLGGRNRNQPGSVAAPETLDEISPLELVALLQRPISSSDVERVGAELACRIMHHLSPQDREDLWVVLGKTEVARSTNGASMVIRNLLTALRPPDPERDAANAANLAAWGVTPTNQPPALALPGGPAR